MSEEEEIDKIAEAHASAWQRYYEDRAKETTELMFSNGTGIMQKDNSKEYFIAGGGLQGGKTIQSKSEFLRSLSLFWRVWPESRPEGNVIVFRKDADYEPFCGWINTYNLNKSHWEVLYSDDLMISCEPGDRWIPLSVLENLP